jgi:hypothetical protein
MIFPKVGLTFLENANIVPISLRIQPRLGSAVRLKPQQRNPLSSEGKKLAYSYKSRLALSDGM